MATDNDWRTLRQLPIELRMGQPSRHRNALRRTAERFGLGVLLCGGAWAVLHWLAAGH